MVKTIERRTMIDNKQARNFLLCVVIGITITAALYHLYPGADLMPPPSTGTERTEPRSEGELAYDPDSKPFEMYGNLDDWSFPFSMSVLLIRYLNNEGDRYIGGPDYGVHLKGDYIIMTQFSDNGRTIESAQIELTREKAVRMLAQFQQKE